MIDTLRADHVSCFGYPRPTTPALCALAGDGVLFERAYTPRTVTTPAIATLFTGLYPHRTGVQRLYQVLPQGARTLPELLRDAGYRTGGFVSSFVMVDDFSGLAQGFDVYDDALTRKEGFRENFERGAAETVSRALEWLKANGPRAFLFVHLIEPHGPYTPGAAWESRFALPPSGKSLPLRVIPAYQRIPGLHLPSEYIGRYDGEIASADEQVGRLMNDLRKLGWYENATVVVTADHGESLGEEGIWFRHGRSVLDPEAHVPLVIRFPSGTAGVPPPGARVPQPVSLKDIFATVIAAAGLSLPAPASVAPPRDLRRAAGGAPLEGPPPVTWNGNPGRVWRIAAHGSQCTVRWTIPGEKLNHEGLWRGSRPVSEWFRHGARREVFPPGAPPRCAVELARRALPVVEDMLTFRRSFPVTFRGDAFTPGFRTDFVLRRGDPVVGLRDREREALRHLGYLE